MSDMTKPLSLLKDKIPPNNTEAEQAILGAILLESDALGTVLQYVRAESFYTLAHQKIFQAVLDLYNKGQRVDILVISEHLRQEGLLDSVGGTAYIASLTDTVPSTANVAYYAKIVLDAAIRRSLLKVSHQIYADVFDETVAYSSVLEQAQKNIFDLTDAGRVLNTAMNFLGFPPALNFWIRLPAAFKIRNSLSSERALRSERRRLRSPLPIILPYKKRYRPPSFRLKCPVCSSSSGFFHLNRVSLLLKSAPETCSWRILQKFKMPRAGCMKRPFISLICPI